MKITPIKREVKKVYSLRIKPSDYKYIINRFGSLSIALESFLAAIKRGGK
jgi:predicted RNA-binding protein YlqC (UPF0109 family)